MAKGISPWSRRANCRTVPSVRSRFSVAFALPSSLPSLLHGDFDATSFHLHLHFVRGGGGVGSRCCQRLRRGFHPRFGGRAAHLESEVDERCGLRRGGGLRPGRPLRLFHDARHVHDDRRGSRWLGWSRRFGCRRRFWLRRFWSGHIGIEVRIGILDRLKLESFDERRRIAERRRDAIVHVAGGRHAARAVCAGIENRVHAPADIGGDDVHPPADICRVVTRCTLCSVFHRVHRGNVGKERDRRQRHDREKEERNNQPGAQ